MVIKRHELIAFDVDGTLVDSPEGLTVWEVLNRRFVGTSAINRRRYEQFQRGELSYPDWVALDIEGWREAGARRESMIEALAPLRLVEGARETLETLRDRGHRLIVISGTLELMLETLYPDHPFEAVFANRVEFDAEGRISGWQATPYDNRGKAEALRAYAAEHEIPLSRCAFVGDSSNDVWVARSAGFAVAINPRCEELEQAANAVIHSSDLRSILPCFVDGAVR
jgi:phosphoserine phosphatase